ncbi:transmembrane 220 family protein [Mariniflexile sp. AS56]|uniref:transmembrane 220 family protein n=1 Tax=Mariniflexile sp. AS56 TaxID=3063957 RepID=UPI0026ED5547|nr:transmembrane 220 family protein [Mariniflexile sp. AS56]MDO7172995.1 transmembrane 220 family protein [Mariniflexile sp. AS56]
MKNPLPRTKLIVNSCLFVVFALFAAIQLNDPDPLVWVLIYMGVAVVSLSANFILIPKKLILVFVLGLLMYASVHFMFLIDWLQTENKSELFGEMVYEKPYLEGTREFLGLIIAVTALLYQLKR